MKKKIQDFNALSHRGDVDMCTLFEEERLEDREEGRAEGKAEGIIDTCLELGFSEEDILNRLQKKLNISLQTAQKYLSMFGKQAV